MGVTRSTLWLAALALGACTTPRTEVLVITDTNMSIPDEVDEMRVDVTGPGGELQTAVARFEPGDPLPPRTLGIVSDGPRLGPYTVRASARLNGIVVVERVAEFELQQGRTLVLRIDLDRICVGMTCGTGETCAGGACRSVTIAPEELVSWNGQLPQPDGSVSGDAGVEVDAGMMDAGMDDAGMMDAGMMDGCTPATETCNGMDDDCDSMIDEGFDVTTDPMNCGACGNVCNLANATADCTASECVVATCDTNFDDCDGNPANGCEADLQNDPDTCGTCTNRCTGGMRNCCAGSCCM